MYLITAATEMEMAPVRQLLAGCNGVDFLVTGVGMLEAAVGLCRKFRQSGEALRGVVNLGVAGAYVDTGVKMLDLCMAKREIIGDLGVSSGEQVFPFTDATIRPPTEFSLQNPLLVRASAILEENEISYYTGVFVTVNAVSGSRSRGVYFRDQYAAICENMEGAAIARTCAAYGVDCLELRTVSNMVVDRDPARWRLAEAIDACAKVAGQLIPELVARS